MLGLFFHINKFPVHSAIENYEYNKRKNYAAVEKHLLKNPKFYLEQYYNNDTPLQKALLYKAYEIVILILKTIEALWEKGISFNIDQEVKNGQQPTEVTISFYIKHSHSHNNYAHLSNILLLATMGSGLEYKKNLNDPRILEVLKIGHAIFYKESELRKKSTFQEDIEKIQSELSLLYEKISLSEKNDQYKGFYKDKAVRYAATKNGSMLQYKKNK